MQSDPDRRAVDYSIVMPVYYNEGSLRATIRSIKEEVIDRHPELSHEFVFVDDGSGDRSLDVLLELRAASPESTTVIKLTRNFGQPSARVAGLSHARGRCVISMSADGQDPNPLISDMLRAHFDEGYEVVICARRGRDESWSRVVASRVFYWTMKQLSFPDMPTGGFDFVLLGRRPLDVILRNQEAQPFFQGQVMWTGFKTKFLEYRRSSRPAGRSRWTFAKKLTLLIDGVLGYSFAPIRVMSLVGILVAFTGFLCALLIVILKLFWGTQVAGWAAIMVALLIMGGLQMLMLGIIGEYHWRTLAEVRNRDRYVIERVYGPEGEGDGDACGRSDPG